MNDKINSLASLVPQLFYDFIARIIPGSVILITIHLLCFEFLSEEIFKKVNNYSLNINNSTFLMFCTVFILAYVLAIFLWRQVEWIRLIIKLFFKKALKNRDYAPKYKITSFFYDFIKSEGYSAKDRITSFLYDFIKTKDYSAGARITKLRAEIHMTEVLVIGFIYCFIINLIIYIKTGTNAVQRSIIACLLLLFIIGILTTRKYFCDRATKAIHNYYLLKDGPDINKKIKDLCTLDRTIDMYTKKEYDEIL